MRFEVSIRCDNDAFCDLDGKPDPGAEVAAILRRLANKIEANLSDYGELLDTSGNKVGRFEFIPEEE
ncbi:MAG: hypothetical protein J2P48_17605 [Alphaproteobacteria bacterium]|nr:hypothetical protein [Alphaproteobacteria bacterium]